MSSEVLSPRSIIQRRLREPDLSLLRQFRELEWSSHNIELTENESTFRQSGAELLADDARTRLIFELLDTWSGRSQRDLTGLRAVDLGSLEGGLALELARHGAEVLGIEGRRENFEKCELVARYFSLPNLRFLQQDVRSLRREENGTFDIVLCCGLLYHLDDSLEFLALLDRVMTPAGLLFIDTHVAPRNAEALAACRLADKLSDLVQLEIEGQGYEGRWFQEFLTEKGHNEPFDSISNPRSFWPTRESLFRRLRHVGFARVMDVYGAFEIEDEMRLRTEFSRLYCLAQRSGKANSFSA